MPDINGISSGANAVQQPAAGQAEAVREQNAAGELRAARGSGMSVAGRVVLGIFTLGISEGIRAIVRHAGSSRAAPQAGLAAPMPGLPAADPREDKDNQALARALNQGGALPAAHRQALSDALQDLGLRFGEDLLAKDAPASSLPGFEKALSKAVRQASGEVTPGALRELAAEVGAKCLAREALAARIAASCEKLGYTERTASQLCAEALKDDPEFAAELLACTDRASAEAKIDELIEVVEDGLRASMANGSLARALESGDLTGLPDQMRDTLISVIGTLRDAFVEAKVPAGFQGLRPLFGEALMQRTLSEVRADPNPVTPRSIRDTLIRRFSLEQSRAALESRVQAACAKIGYPTTDAHGIMRSILANSPEFASNLAECRDPASIDSFLTSNLGFVRDQVQLRLDLWRSGQAAQERAVSGLARETGLLAEEIRASLGAEGLQGAFASLTEQFLSGSRAADRNAMSEAFAQAADRFAETKAALYRSVDALGLPKETAHAWKAAAIREKGLDQPGQLAALHQAGSSVNAGSLLSALKAPKGEFSSEEIFGLVQSLAAQVSENLPSRLGEESWSRLGRDGQALARSFAVQAMMSGTPKLGDALAERPQLVAWLQGRIRSALADAGTAAQSAVLQAAGTLLTDLPKPAAEFNRELAAAASGANRGELPAGHALALSEAAAGLRSQFGEDSLPADALHHRGIGLRVADGIRASRDRVDASRFAGIFLEAARAEVARSAFESLLAGRARAQGLAADPEGISRAAERLIEADPGLAGLIAAAQSREAVAEILKGISASAGEELHAGLKRMGNLELGQLIREGSPLPDSHKAALSKAVRELEAGFGQEAARLGTQSFRNILWRAVNITHTEVSGEMLREIALREGRKMLSEAVVAKRIALVCEKLGYTARTPEAVCAGILAEDPEFAEEVSACANRAAADVKAAEAAEYAEDMLRAAVANAALARALGSGDLQSLSAPLQAALSEALGELRARFGEENIPAGAKLSDVMGADQMKKIADRIALEPNEVTPAALRELVTGRYSNTFAVALLKDAVGAVCRELGFGAKDPADISRSILKESPEFSSGLVARQDLASIRAFIQSNEGFLKEQIGALQREAQP